MVRWRYDSGDILTGAIASAIDGAAMVVHFALVVAAIDEAGDHRVLTHCETDDRVMGSLGLIRRRVPAGTGGRDSSPGRGRRTVSLAWGEPVEGADQDAVNGATT